MSGVVAFALLVNLAVFSSGIEDGWKGIKPLEARKSDVERIAGNFTSELNGYYLYKTPEAVLDVNYSTTPCKMDTANRGDYEVPEGTVLDYIITHKKPVKLSDLEFARDKYERDDGGGHLLNYEVYVNKEDGVVIEVYVENQVEYVGRILIQPSLSRSAKLKCKSLKGD